MGHEEGDRVITEIGITFGGVFKKKYSYRIGGDEFVAIIPEREKDKFEDLVAKLRAKNLEASLSVGTVWSKSSKDIKMLLKFQNH